MTNLPAVAVAAFYKFVPLPDHRALRDALDDLCTQLRIKGTLLIAPEGLNGTLAGDRDDLANLMQILRSYPCLADLEHKESFAQSPPFRRLKVRCKREIVALGRPETNPAEGVGAYVPPGEWNELISDPDVLLLDTRNNYEYAAGTFRGAIDPGTRSFREFPAYVQQRLGDARSRKIATFCTGGIRCEKATAYLIEQGFERVYHLKGGILRYLEEIPPEESLWRGECFVFDERVTVGHGLQPGSASLCAVCGWAVPTGRVCVNCGEAEQR